MSVRGWLIAPALAAWVLFAAGIAGAQGFAGLGAGGAGFAVPQPGVPFRFPRDHGAHPDYRIEWWYLTATLDGDDGRAYGVQWTLFRTALAPGDGQGWATPQLWMGHAGLTTPNVHFAAERWARGGVGQAGVVADPFEAWIDDWYMRGRADAGEDGEDALSRLDLAATGEAFSFDLRLAAEGPLVRHGRAGYSVKSAGGQASYYYSQPFYRAEGVLRLPEGNVAVTGTAWLDREWSSQPLSETQTGWDWFSLQFTDGARLMGFRLRDTARADFTAATWIAPDGTPTAYPDGAFEAEPLGAESVAGRSVPVRWRVRLAERGVDIVTEPVNPQSWMAVSFPYWEGPIRFSGSHEGRGYLEMTGYE